MCGFIVQLVEHRTGIAEVTGSNPVEALIFSGFFFPIAQIGKLTARIILHFHLHPQFKYELFHIYFTSRPMSLLTTELAYDFSMLRADTLLPHGAAEVSFQSAQRTE